MKFPFYQSLVFRFMLGGIVFLVISFSLQRSNSHHILKDYAVSQTETMIKQISETLSLALTPLIQDEQYIMLADYFDGQLQGQEIGVVYIALIDVNNQIITASSNTPFPLPETAIKIEEQLSKGIIHVSQPILLADNQTGHLRFGFSTESINQTIQRLYFDDILVLVLVTGIAIIIFLLLGTRVSNNLNHLVEINHLFAEGNWDVRATIKGNHELTYLANSFNTLAASIAEKTHTLKQKQHSLEQAQSVAKLGNWLYRNKDDHFELSDEACHILGLDRDQSNSYIDFSKKLNITHLFDIQKASDQSTKEIDEQIRILVNGESKWIHYVARIHFNTISSNNFIEGTIQDISGIKKIEEQLVEQNLKVLSLLEKINGISWELDLNSKKFSYISPNATRIMGYPLSVWNDLESWVEMVYPADREFAVKFCTTETQAGRDHVFEYRMKKNSGEIIWVMDLVSVIKNDLDQPIALAGFIVDITHQYQNATALRQKDNYQHALLNNFPFMVWIKDTEGKYLAVNQPFADVAGYADLNSVAGKSDEDLWPKELAITYQAQDQQVMSQLKKLEIEEKIFHQGKHRWFETFKTPILDDDGQLLGTVGFSRNITERKITEEKLKLSASVFTHANEGISITDAEGTILDVNRSFSRITGYSHAEVLGKNHRLLKSGRHDEQFYQTLWHELEKHGQWIGELWNRRKNGESYIEFLSINAVHNADGKVHNYVALFNDITTQKEHQQKLEYIAHYDALTRLPNRVLLADRLNQAMERSNRSHRLLALAYLDLDGFKEVNDQYGHGIGDQLLENLAQRFNDAIRKEDTISRLGGDEFVAVFVDLPEKEECMLLIERLLGACSESFYINNLLLQLSASVGITFYPQEEVLDPDQLIRQADQAMYQAKLSGKNRYHIFDSEKNKSQQTRHESIKSIRKALDQNQFVLFYQPKVNMKTGFVYGVEALIRWQHPEKGLLAPDNFLPIIENDPLIIDIGNWVLKTALSQLDQWQKQAVKLSVSVNIAPLQLQQENCLDTIKNLLAMYPDLKPNSLELEILESSALHDINSVSDVISACKAIGVNFALDDFGTGYSSLTYLKRLPATTLKIDRSFVRDILDDPDDLALLQGIIGLSSSFRREVIAEGVESENHGQLLLQLGCENAQGYGIAKPMPANELQEWLSSWKPYPSWRYITPVPRKHLDILVTTVAYRFWINSIKSHLLDNEDGNLYHGSDIELSNQNFEQWYQQQAMFIYQHSPEFKLLYTVYESMLKTLKAATIDKSQLNESASQTLLKCLDENLITMQLHLNRLLTAELSIK